MSTETKQSVPNASAHAWEGFAVGLWQDEINTRDFIQRNYTEYVGNADFLSGASSATNELMVRLNDLFEVEHEHSGVLAMENDVPSTLTSHQPGYLIQSAEKIVGLQTDQPLKQAFMPFCGIRMAESALESNGYETNPLMHTVFNQWRKTHNQGVFDAYTPEMILARKNKILTGLPDAYGRGRIIGDYRRVALYGIERLMQEKARDWENVGAGAMTESVIRLREEIKEQHRALEELKTMAASYGFDISLPAKTAQEAIQWLYFGYLGAIKAQNGAAMSIGRISTFLDIYLERDLKRGLIDENDAQELIDHLVMKLRMVRFARTPEYNDLFSGFPIWATLSVGGMSSDGRSLVTKTDFRFLSTLSTMGPSPEPNITVLWSSRAPEGFKQYAAKVAEESHALQFENEQLLRDYWGFDDVGIACCVSATVIGKNMQFFGARANLAKALLYAINGGIDEKSGVQVGPKLRPLTGEYLNYEDVWAAYKSILDCLANLYVNTLNVIHYMHDKYAYEAVQLALMDSHLERTFATGIAGISQATDSLMAIKHGHVKVIRDVTGLATDYVPEHGFPTYGNDNLEADAMANQIIDYFMTQIRRQHFYREAKPTTSLLTITSNVVYGKATGNMPDGRRAGVPLSPGANPSYDDGHFLGEKHGLLASLNSVARLNYGNALDGISNTQIINPSALGKNQTEIVTNLCHVLDGYFNQGGYHLNVNVFDQSLLKDAQAHPEKYPNLTIRVSGYAVKFRDLTAEQQNDVMLRTAHAHLTV
ncbi:formate C-acetyltransferase [Weissella diestrammenae]|uniref:Formate acetyltransferase n=1 Tax=Weissella diestrammenae TaxID=1162633 RepID=A0A7G9T6F5_9LACO|nr:formate C-acetyltransferase [Weissella diestrammenae]MCM0583269.1 formate C-acetyltransferase [Weissella diestrammenae]QNN75680.1 formate C-acetyltransferase [Weissella diestrammenae]